MNRHVVLGLLVFGLTFAQVERARATTIMQMGLLELLSNSGAVVEGTVTSSSVKQGDADNLPVTTYSLCDLQVHHGKTAGPPAACTSLSVVGGATPTGTMWYAGSPALQVGDHIIALLINSPSYDSPFVGWWQGVFRFQPLDVDGCVHSYAGHQVLGLDAYGAVRTASKSVLPVPGIVGDFDEVAISSVSSKQAVENVPTTICINRKVFLQELSIATSILAVIGASSPVGLPSTWGPRTNRHIEAANPSALKIGGTP